MTFDTELDVGVHRTRVAVASRVARYSSCETVLPSLVWTVRIRGLRSYRDSKLRVEYPLRREDPWGEYQEESRSWTFPIL